jgi:hypothetical protein
MIKSPRMIVKMPVIRKLGKIVIAGSQAFQIFSGIQGEPIEANIKLRGRVLPCKISKYPCSNPAIPAIKPKAVATILVALLMDHSLP